MGTLNSAKMEYFAIYVGPHGVLYADMYIFKLEMAGTYYWEIRAIKYLNMFS